MKISKKKEGKQFTLLVSQVIENQGPGLTLIHSSGDSRSPCLFRPRQPPDKLDFHSTIRAEEYPFSREKAPHSSGGIEVFRMHEKQAKCSIGGSSALLARLFFVPQNISHVASPTGKIQGVYASRTTIKPPRNPVSKPVLLTFNSCSR